MVKPPSMLTVMGHPDDAELWAGGTLARHAEAGAKVTIAVPSHDPVRDAEAAAGASVLGASLRLLPELTTSTIAGLLAELSPDVVITHGPRDVHPDHRRACRAVLDALPMPVITTGHPQRVYTCDSYNGLSLDGPNAPHTIIDITTTFTTKMRALTAHRSQPIDEHFGPMAETLARLHGGRIGTAYGEAFTPVPVLGRLPASDFL
ncbi:PIG-L family deacetylase [Spongiactinospora sp. TRM90649]|uniref:PIG-L deacetylase family protein n=1 Tax=Spongiactinospora sp. TRM90649 TaxID=3031114 RepID=UPI0023FA3A0C|nr:PIG-L family deacetylase [Spongiactinospora sp. TRM90649]MDF5759040.1 GlcNAc-PI de-N-acetylase [Spongiactinospora sp. TRM90649]